MKLAQPQSGFALLLTLVIVSVVLAIGLSLLDITLKQLELSGTARDSEVAFHAAYAGLECAQYWRLQEFFADTTETNPPDINWCITNSVTKSDQSVGIAVNPLITHSQYEIDDTDVCIEIDVFLFDARASVVSEVIPELVSSDPVECTSGICTYILSRGYNRACTELTSTRTIQREIFAKF